MNPPKISVIVPVYNVEKYLNRCIDSILAQTFTDFEVLLIDDGSTDQSGKICDEYGKKDNRVRVFHQINRGVGSARNKGLKNTIGDWICFIDADDFISNKFLEKFYSIISQVKDIDAIICGCNSYVTDEQKKELFSFKKAIYNTENFISTQYHHLACWGYMFRRNLLIKNHIIFNEELCLSEDRAFILECFFNIHKIGVLGGNYYYYCQNPDSVCQTPVTLKKIRSQLTAAIFMTTFWQKYKLDPILSSFLGEIIRETFMNYLELRIKLWSQYAKDKKDIRIVYAQLKKHNCLNSWTTCARISFILTLLLLIIKKKIK